MSRRAREFHQLYATLRISAQMSFYEARAAEYRRAHRQAVVVRNALLLAAAVAGALGQITSGTPRAAWSVGVAVLAAIAAAVTTYEALIAFPRLQKLYADAARNLKEAYRSEIGQWGQLVVKAATPAPPPAATGGDHAPEGPSPGP